MKLRMLWVLLLLWAGNGLSGQATGWNDVYLYVGGAEDWNAVSASWDHKRIAPDTRAMAVRRMLPNQAAERLDLLQRQLKTIPGVDFASVQRYWIAPVIRASVNDVALGLLEQSPLVVSIQAVPAVQPDASPASLAAMPPAPNGHEPAHDVIGAATLWRWGYTGYGQKAYIIDSGVDPTHPGLGDKFWGDVTSPAHAWFEPGGSPLPRDCGNHGTLVAGVILGLNRATNDTTGVAPEGRWMASPPAGGTACSPNIDVLAALQWALDPDGDSTTTADIPQVINNSWSIDLGSNNAECAGPYRDAMAALEAAGIAVVFSAGNDGPGVGSIPSPKNLNINPVNVFCVGSVNGNSTAFPIANSSSRGPSSCGGPLDSIKPEVVAPGVQVRTTGPGGGYFNVSGTSFSAPQVSGAVLLLREAFPMASGKQILESLYYTATDLGDPGEDNTYGNGMIHLPSAFAWLQGQGFVPVVVNDSNDVAIQALELGDDMTCDSVIFPFLILKNNGPNPIQSLRAIRSRNGVTDTVTRTGVIAPGTTVFWGSGSDTIPEGNYTWSINIFEVNGHADLRYLDNMASGQVVRLPSPGAGLLLPEVCTGAQISATAGEGSFAWYDSEQATTPFDTAGTVLLGPYQQSTMVYLASRTRLTAGKAYAGDTGGYQEDYASLVFDAEVPFVLESVKVVSQGDGNRRIQLRTADGTVLRDTTMFINFGIRELPLGFSVPAGTELELGVESQLVRLLTVSEGISYPYAAEGVLSITGSSISPSAYPYFFDWKIRYEGCRTPVEVTVVAGDVAVDLPFQDTTLYLAQGAMLDIDLAGSSLSDIRWDSGDGATENGPVFSHSYSSEGDFQLTVTAAGQEGCYGSAAANVQVVDWALDTDGPESWQLTAFPNPTTSILHLNTEPLAGQSADITLLNAQGSTVYQQTGVLPAGGVEIDLSPYPAGIYLVRIWFAGTRQSLRVMKK